MSPVSEIERDQEAYTRRSSQQLTGELNHVI